MAKRLLRYLMPLVLCLPFVVNAQGYHTPAPTWRSTQTNTSATDHILVKRSGQPVQSVSISSYGSVDKALSYWNSQSGIEYAETDNLYHALGQQTTWGWTQLQVGEAATTNGVTGAGIIVAVVDSGVDYVHEDLANNMWVNTGEIANDGIDNDGNGYVDDYHGYDFIGSMYTAPTLDSDPQDEAGHGTHVAGIIAAENNSIGTRGVAPSATIMPVKVLDSNGLGFDSNIASGIEYAVDNGADIINLSLGGTAASNTIKTAIDYAESHNVLVIAAAGNSSSFSQPSYPAAYSNVVSVGALTEDGIKAYYSNWGKVDVMAPGDDILSTIPGDKYASYSGTSMASPQVAGVAALVMQKFGTTDTKTVRHILETTATDFGTMAGPDYVAGYGTVDALAATTARTTTDAYLFSDAGSVIADGSDDAVVTVSVRTSANVAVAGDVVTWSTTEGTLLTTSSTTDANGQASVTFTADDVHGLVTITADPASAEPTTLQIAVCDDAVYPITITTIPYESDLTTTYYQPGDTLQIISDPTSYDGQTHDIVISSTVTDPQGNVVTAMTDTSGVVAEGVTEFGEFEPWIEHDSSPVTIPADASSGAYTITVTVTEQTTGETVTNTGSFWVGTRPNVLIIDNDAFCSDSSIEAVELLSSGSCVGAGQKLAAMVSTLGYKPLVWNAIHGRSLSVDDLLNYPLVIVADATYVSPYQTDYSAYSDYLQAGGHMLISSESLSQNMRNDEPVYNFMWGSLHVNFGASLIQPSSVSGYTASDFAGQNYDLDWLNLNGSGTHTTYWGDELLPDPAATTVEPIFAYSRGDTTDHIAGVRVNESNYRAVFLSFGLEAINDSGSSTAQSLLENLTHWLLGQRPTIQRVTPEKLENNVDHTITIHGTHFQMTGETKIKLRHRWLTNVSVQDSTTITATVPSGINPGSYTLHIVRPDGRKRNRANAVQITAGGLVVTSASSDFVSNNTDRDIILTGNHFSASTQVYFNDIAMSHVAVADPTSLTVSVPQNFQPGHYAITVKNSAGMVSDLHSIITVRIGFSIVLKMGDSDDQVLALEKRLKGYGYFTAVPDTTFDSVTQEALIQYQIAQTIPATGKTDPLTQYTLNTNP